MSLLVVLGHAPYDVSDVAWNALRLVSTAREQGLDVRLFLINDGVDVARSAPPGAEFDLGEMLSELTAKGVEVLLCGTCMDRCGIPTGEVVPGVERGSMDALVSWLQSSDRALSF